MIQDLRKRMQAKNEKMQQMFNKDLEEQKNKQWKESVVGKLRQINT